MNAITVMRAMLCARAPLAALVSPDDVVAGTVQQGVAPAVGISELSRVETPTVSRNSSCVLVRARVQVTVYAKSYPQQKELLAATSLGKGVHSGTIAGVVVRSILPAGVGPDFSNDDAGLYEQSRDFIVTYIEPQ